MIDKSQRSNNTKIKLKEFYDSSQAYLDRLKKHDEQAFISYVNLCKKCIPIGSSILDVGCGTGLSSYLLAEAGFRVVGMDISEFFLSEGTKKYKGQKGLSFEVGDASKMPFSNQSFDAVCSYTLLEHVADPITTLKEMANIVKRRGLVVVFAPNHLSPFVNWYIRSLKVTIRMRMKDDSRLGMGRIRLFILCERLKLFFLQITKAFGLNKKIYYLEPILSDKKDLCGGDFDATWLVNWFDIENILKESGFSIKDTRFCFKGRVMRIMRMSKLPQVLQSLYLKMVASCIIVGANNKVGEETE